MDEPKLIFLDVNGVIDSFNHNEEMYRLGIDEPFTKHYFDWNCLHNLYNLVNETDSYIVVSSEWRRTRKLMRRLLSVLSFYELDKRVVGKIPNTEYREGSLIKNDRGRQIQEYLDKHPHSSFVVLDDIKWDLERFEDELIWTNPRVGLTEDDVKKAIDILNRNEKTLRK